MLSFRTRIGNIKRYLFDSPDLPIVALSKSYGLCGCSVVHCGAGFAEEAELYASLNFKKVFWIEANPFMIESIQKRLSKYANQTVLNSALWNEVETLQFNIASNWGSSSFLPSSLHSSKFPDISFSKKIRVTTCTLDSLGLHGEAPLFLVLDVQGAELKVLEGAKQTLTNTNYLYLEFSNEELYLGSPTLKEIRDYLQSDFDLLDCKLSKKHDYGNALFVRKGTLKFSFFRRIYRKLFTGYLLISKVVLLGKQSIN
jgi:FkbM family methyltransferase